MNLLEKLNTDMIQAMEEKNKDRLTVLRMVKGAMQLEKINQREEMTEEMLIDCVNKQIKLRKDSLFEFEKANREDLITKTQAEIEILKDYLPKQLTEEEIDQIIENAFMKIHPTSTKDMGIIMKTVTPLLKGKADMKEVSTKIKEKLSNL